MTATAPESHPQRSSRTHRWAARTARGVVALYAIGAVGGLWYSVRSYTELAPPDVSLLAWSAVNGVVLLVFSTFVVVGALIVVRRPDNTVGWAMLAGGAAYGLGASADVYALVTIGGSTSVPPAPGIAAKLLWAAGSRAGAVLVLVILPLLYPDGRLPSPRWRPVAWVVATYTAVWAVGTAAVERLTGLAYPIGREQMMVYDVPNPLAAEWLQPVVTIVTGPAQGLVLLAFIGLAVAAVVVRFRRSAGIQRQQMKWFTYTAGVYLCLIGLSVVTALLDVPEALLQTVQGVAYLSMTAFPVAIGIAVLRYRLYEIDRIISRTVSYGLVVAILAAVYTGAVVGLGAAVSAATGGGDSDLVVAASTLLAAGLFRPVRTRVQSVVDRRFNRTGYDARQAVETFARDVRDEVDLDRLCRRTAETAATAVEPTRVSLWLHDDRDGGDS